jgi:hypothetical protein
VRTALALDDVEKAGGDMRHELAAILAHLSDEKATGRRSISTTLHLVGAGIHYCANFSAFAQAFHEGVP